MSAAVDSSLLQQYQAPIEKPFLSPNQKAIVHTIVQIAVRVFFVFAVVIMTAALLPLAFHAIVVPVIGISAAILSAFFFQLDVSAYAQPIEPFAPLLQPIADIPLKFIAPLPAAYPQELPIRGLIRQGMNCCVNASSQCHEGDPGVAQWVRTPLPAGLEPFLHYLAQYDLRPEWIQGFRNYYATLAPAPDVLLAFDHYFSQMVYPPEVHDQYVKFRDIFKGLLRIQPYFSQFFAAHDHVIQNNLALGHENSQNLRIVLSALSGGIDPNPNVQLDATEVSYCLLNHLPNSLKTHIRETTRRSDGTATEREEYTPIVSLALPKGNSKPSMVDLVNDYTREETIQPENQGLIRRSVQFVEHPPVLRCHIKRFESVSPPKSWLTKLLPDWWPGMQWRAKKLHTPVAFDPISLRIADGTARDYTCNTFLVHLGDSATSGHYIAYRKVMIHGQPAYFQIDDHLVTQIDQQAWERASQEAYMVYYFQI